jgi:hypothetical protein
MRTKPVGTKRGAPRRWHGLELCVALSLAGCAELASLSDPPPVRGRPVRTQPASAGTRPGRVASGRPAVVLDKVSGAPGQTVSFSATLRTGGATVAGAQNDIQFDPANTPLASKSAGKPQCAVNPTIGKNATAFTLLPNKCNGRTCTGMRALVLSLTDTRPIADGSVLYTCTVRIPSTAQPGIYPLAISAVAMSTPDGQEVPRASGVAGAITVTAKR